MASAPCCAAPRSPSSRCSRWPSASAPTPLSSACSTRSFCASCPSRIPNSSSCSRRSARTMRISDARDQTDLYSYPFYRQMQQRNAVFSSTAAIFSMLNQVHGTVVGRTETEPMNVQLVSGTYFSTLGVNAQMGRALTDADDNSEGDHPVAMISNAWWKRSLAKDPGVLGRQLKLGSTVFTIVGVAPPEFFGTKVGEAPDIWVPLSMIASVPPSWGRLHKDNFSESLYIPGPPQARHHRRPGHHHQRQPALPADSAWLSRLWTEPGKSAKAGQSACPDHAHGHRHLGACAATSLRAAA